MDWTLEELRQINSMTKYPSIPTYHGMGEKGILQEDEVVQFEGTVEVFEKIDGTNSRVILLPNFDKMDNDYLIGSREELLHFGNDLIWNPDLGIVDVLKPFVEFKNLHEWGENRLEVFYIEVYGGKVQAKIARNYTSKNEVGFRIFDFASFPRDQWIDMLNWDLESFSGWRERGGTPFVSTEKLSSIAQIAGFKMVPHIAKINALDLPKTLEDTLEWLNSLVPQTYAALDEKALKKPEGVVIRNSDRKTIAKIRFQDYERTLKKLGSKLVSEN